MFTTATSRKQRTSRCLGLASGKKVKIGHCQLGSISPKSFSSVPARRPLERLGSAGLLWAINGGRLMELHRLRLRARPSVSHTFEATFAFFVVTARWLVISPKGDLVDRLQSLGFPPPCYPNYGAPDSCPSRFISC